MCLFFSILDENFGFCKRAAKPAFPKASLLFYNLSGKNLQKALLLPVLSFAILKLTNHCTILSYWTWLEASLPPGPAFLPAFPF